MKILVISLLRLGDILLATSILRSLKKENPGAEIHILINGQFQSVVEMIPFVDKVFTFDRDSIQQIIGSPDRNLLEAYFRIEDLVEQLQGQKYDQVINLTHNRLSGWLTTLIGCANTRGVVLQSNGKFSMGSDWFTYLNNISVTRRQQVFHFVDVFHYGTGLETLNRRIELVETKEGKAFAKKILASVPPDRKIVFLQPCASEPKKTFSPEKWGLIAKTLLSIEEKIQIFVLGSPSEKRAIDEVCGSQEITPVTCNLDHAFSLLQRGHLLITGDTSIKHLASATKIKILEMSLGSSEYHKTGAYAPGAVIVQGLADCAPCPHRSPCSQASHICAERIPVEVVSMCASSILRQDESALRTLAHEYQDTITLLRTHINTNGDWAAYPLGTSFSVKEINQWVDRTSQKLHLQRVQEKAVGEYGTEGVELKILLQNIFPDRPSRDWLGELKSLEGQVSWFESQVENYLTKLRSLLSTIQDATSLQGFIKDLEHFCQRAKQSGIFESYGKELESRLEDPNSLQSPFLAVKRIRETLTEAHQRTRIELKLIRGLQTGFMEVI